MKFSKFSELVNRILSNNHSHHRDMDVTIVVHSPGRIGSTPSVEVQSIQAGFDWDSGKVLIFPAQPLTTLTPEQITDITDSVRKGQSWHAYQEYKKHKEQLEKLSIELDAAKQRVAELEAKPVSQTYKLNQISGNSPVTTDGWISCSERMPDTKTAVLVAREFGRKGDWRMKWATYIPGHPDANDGWVVPGASWIPSHWMPLPEPPQESKSE